MNPVRLLLVEDDAVSRGFLVLALESMPATVVDVATDAAQALAHAREAPHGLWLLDANLPDATGEGLLRDLLAIQPGVPALCLTAEVDEARLASLRAAGFLDVLGKPLAIALLHAAVRRALAATILPIWDDAQSLQALGGNVSAMQAMRGLFVAELPGQAGAIHRAIATGDLDAARSELHKLRASCGFVGSLRLLDAVDALARDLGDAQGLERFRAQVLDALATAQSRS